MIKTDVQAFALGNWLSVEDVEEGFVWRKVASSF